MEAKDPLTSLALDVPYLSVKTRNTFADSIFYDVRSLSAEEQAQLNPLNDREGSVVVVPGKAAALQKCFALHACRR
jgi:hypothetical protein